MLTLFSGSSKNAAGDDGERVNGPVAPPAAEVDFAAETGITIILVVLCC